VAGPCFEIRTWLDGHAVHDELDAELFGDGGRPTGIVTGFGPDAMVDVVSDRQASRVEGKREQRSRVGATREGARKTRSGDGEVAAG
jgi:hypothetical protein